MKYKNHTIEAQYLPGAEFKIDKHGLVKPRKPKPEDIDYFTVTDTTGFRWNESTMIEAKQTIGKFEAIVNNSHYPCPSVTSDYDCSVIFAAIEKGSQ